MRAPLFVFLPSHLLPLLLGRHNVYDPLILHPQLAQRLIVPLKRLPVAEALKVAGFEAVCGGAGCGLYVAEAEI